MSAYTVGEKVGSGAGWLAAKVVHVTIKTATGLGSFGEGAMVGAETKYISTTEQDEAKRAVAIAAAKVAVAQLLAKRASDAAAALVLAQQPIAVATPMAVATS